MCRKAQRICSGLMHRKFTVLAGILVTCILVMSYMQLDLRGIGHQRDMSFKLPSIRKGSLITLIRNTSKTVVPNSKKRVSTTVAYSTGTASRGTSRATEGEFNVSTLKTTHPPTTTTTATTTATSAITSTTSIRTTTTTGPTTTMTTSGPTTTMTTTGPTTTMTTIGPTTTTSSMTTTGPTTTASTTTTATTISSTFRPTITSSKPTTTTSASTPTSTKRTSTSTFAPGKSSTRSTLAMRTTTASMTGRPTADAKTLEHFKSREMSPKDKEIVLDILRVFIEVANSHNWTWFISGGSLLGSVRHQGMIPWDDDIDVSVNKSHLKELKEVFKKMEPNYTVHDRGNDPILKLFSNRSKLCVLKTCRYKYPYIDVCFFTENKIQMWDTHPFFAPYKYSKSYILPLHVRPFEGFMVYAPKVSLHWIKVTYGLNDVCQTWMYFHNHETNKHQVVKVKCESLRNRYPFVHRRWVNGTMEETLRVGNKTLSVRYIDGELEWTATKPYSTVPIGGKLLK